MQFPTTLLAATTGLALILSPLAVAAEALNIAWSPSLQTPQLDVARAQGYLDEAGLTVNVTTFQSGREAFEALLGGQVDLASMAEFPAATGILTGQPFRIVTELSHFTGSRIIGSLDAGPLASPADLAGRRIGTTLGTNVDFALSTLLAQNGVSAEIVNAAPTDLPAALARGDVDAVSAFPNAYPQLRQALGDRATEISNDAYAPHFIMTASLDAAETKAPAVESLIEAFRKADAFIAANPLEAAQIMSDAASGNVSADTVLDQWKDTVIGVGLTDRLANLLAQQGGWIVDQGKIKADKPDASTVKGFFMESSPTP
ncbi:ABC transporter substrate-binding protein [uncultured Paracoccus sp.]|uniref:ABC transporter substrate-binding protein n=1 Tax=uncultured Paracoccus sp. TaxID=189685 RepID=UPI0025CE8E06|nr:ABC transporter substrate-binding protein [uncultured Paracoccus sp.]